MCRPEDFIEAHGAFLCVECAQIVLTAGLCGTEGWAAVSEVADALAMLEYQGGLADSPAPVN
jgi:hypothetical protein